MTSTEIRAEELQPDKYRQKDATQRFQQLQEAYLVLGNPERKRLFDRGDYEAAVNPATKATEADFDPVLRDGCGCISAQPRFVQYDRVISVVFASYKIRPAGVFSLKCASKRSFVKTLITGAGGWLGGSLPRPGPACHQPMTRAQSNPIRQRSP
jgi:hypothetical protein